MAVEKNLKNAIIRKRVKLQALIDFVRNFFQLNYINLEQSISVYSVSEVNLRFNEADKISYQAGVDSCRTLVENLPTLTRLIPKTNEIHKSFTHGEKRSLGNDLLAINEAFKTKVEINGIENIPEKGGVVLAISHV